ncbi:MAG: DUF11 domain-containing protein [Acidobacteria bacterium Pan2503]|uniref:DUF11 domain-containing protein n=1 Tax=Candidatus Acidiferrum panamense TaxID=2741543 RepID=A0A7V8NWL2_9BACT|nr:DUF11 domain-containing protein [Candidatus Acidoferrum panamensis]
MTATVAGVATPANFSLTNTAGTAASITATSGTPQSATINTAFAAPLVATVKDVGGNPVAGVTVTFSAPSTGASGSFAGGINTAVTNASGVATSAVFTANGTAGSYTVTASVAGVATPANFALTNTAPGTADLELTKRGSPNPVTVGRNLTYMLTVKNSGPAQATHVTITDTLPERVSFVPRLSSSSCELTRGSVVTCKIGSIAADEKAIAIIVVKPTKAAHGRITNRGTVSADQTDPTPADNSAAETTTVRHGPPVRPSISPTVRQ